MENEIWSPVPDYEDYQVSNFGRVKSLKLGKVKILKPILDRNGYLQVKLGVGDVKRKYQTRLRNRTEAFGRGTLQRQTYQRASRIYQRKSRRLDRQTTRENFWR